MIRQRKELLHGHGHGEEDLTSGGIRGRFQEPEISKFDRFIIIKKITKRS